MRDADSLKHAQKIRKDLSEPEMRMWLQLRAARFRGVKFRRQNVVGKLIVDFASNHPKLAIEIDGDTHAGRESYDAQRSQSLEEQGYRVIRFANSDVMSNMEGVLQQLGLVIDEMAPPPPTPSPEGEGALSSHLP